MNGGFYSESEDYFFDNLDKQNFSSAVNFIGVVKCKCNSCGSSYIVREKISNCLFCGSSNIMDDNYMGEVDACYVLPFTKSESDALKEYKRIVLKNPLIPFSLKKKKSFASIKKAYLLESLNDLNIRGMTKYNALDKVSSVQGRKKVDVKSKYEVLNTVNFDYVNIMGNNNSKILDEVFLDISSYDFNNMVAFDVDYLNDCPIVVGNLVESDVLNKLGGEVMKTSLGMIKDNIKHDLKKLNQHNLVVSSVSKKMVLLPVYILNVKVKDKDFLFLMNGQTGIASSNVTFGKAELVVFSLIVFTLVFFIAFLIAYFV